MSRAKHDVRFLIWRVLRLGRLVFGLVLALPLRLIAPWYRIEIQRIWTERIGHLALEPELFLSTRDAVPLPRTRTYFYADGSVANTQLLTMWQRVLPFGPSWLLKSMFIANKRFPWLDLAAREWDELHFDLRPLNSCAPHVTFTEDEETRGRELLAALGLNSARPYVCLAARDSAYLANILPNRDWSYHDYRNSDIQSYIPMAEWLAGNGYDVVRMGSIVTEAIRSSHPHVFDYATSDLRSPFADVYLYANCAASISTATGVDSLAMLFRRPMGIVNLTASGGFQLGEHLKLVLLKDFVRELSGEPLPLDSDEINEGLAIFRTDEFKTMGIELRDNTSKELVEFAHEFLAILNGTWSMTPEEQGREQVLKDNLARHLDLSSATFHFPKGWLRSRSNGTSAE